MRQLGEGTLTRTRTSARPLSWTRSYEFTAHDYSYSTLLREIAAFVGDSDCTLVGINFSLNDHDEAVAHVTVEG